MNTVVITEYNPEHTFNSPTAVEEYVKRTFLDVVSFQVGQNMIQLVFPSGEQKVVTGFIEIEITPSVEVMESNIKHYEEMLKAAKEAKETPDPLAPIS